MESIFGSLHDVFLDGFETCLGISADDIGEAFIACVKLTVTNGRILFQPGIK